MTGGTLRGQVVDAATRQPIREFVLKLRRADSKDYTSRAWEARTFTTPDGRFVWDRVEPTTWLLGVVAKGYQSFVASGLEVRDGETTPERVLPLQAGYVVRGRVFDRATGAGLAAANVSFHSASGTFMPGGDESWRLRPSGATGKDGAFVLEGVPLGRGMVFAWTENYAGQSLDIVVGRATRPLSIGLTRGATVAGRLVTAGDRAPIAGEVSLITPDGNGTRSQSTQEDGSFSFDNLAAGSYTLRGAAGALSAQEPIELGADERREGIVLMLQARQSIRGRVTGLAPEALAELSIRATPLDETFRMFWDDGTKVDAQGAYVLHGLTPGRVQVRAAANSGVGRSMVKTVEVPASGDLTVNFEFPRGVRVSGRVTRDGKPLADAWIGPEPVGQHDVQASSAKTTAQGDYVIEDLPRGDYRLRTTEYASEIIRVVSDTVFDIDLAGGSLSGRLLLEGGEVPIAGAFVTVRPAERRASRLWLRGGSNQFGEFTLTGLAPGDYVLTAYKPGHTMYRERLSYTPANDRIEIRMRPAPGVQVTARDAVSGEPLRIGFMVEVLGTDERDYLPVDVDARGVVRIPSALAGATLSFGAFGYTPAVIRDWDGERLEVRLTRESRVDAK